MKIDYTNLSFTQLIDKIESNRFFDLPRMVREAFRRLLTRVESLETPPYKVYTALLSQSGTDAPVATVLENTLGGDVVWSYEDEGIYMVNSEGLFTENKTYVSITNSSQEQWSTCMAQPIDSNFILTEAFSLGAGSEITYANSIFEKTSFEIRVYN